MGSPLTSQQQKILDDLLIEAVRDGNLDNAKLYVSRGADVNVKVSNFSQRYNSGNNTYSYITSAELFHFMCATYFRNDMADFLLAQGARVDARDTKGNTPLMMAVMDSNYNRANYLVSQGADPFAANADNIAVLEAARRLDKDRDGATRQRIIDVLVKRLPEPGSAKSSKPAFDAHAAPSNDDKQQGIVAPRTASFGNKDKDKDAAGGKKPSGGFRL